MYMTIMLPTSARRMYQPSSVICIKEKITTEPIKELNNIDSKKIRNRTSE